MKTKKKEVDKVFTYPRIKEVGNFGTLHNSIKDDERLSGDAFKLLYCLLNNQEGWQINIKAYSRKYNWSKTKQSSVVKELIECGYMKQVKTFVGKLPDNKSGFEYNYTVSNMVI